MFRLGGGLRAGFWSGQYLDRPPCWSGMARNQRRRAVPLEEALPARFPREGNAGFVAKAPPDDKANSFYAALN